MTTSYYSDQEPSRATGLHELNLSTAGRELGDDEYVGGHETVCGYAMKERLPPFAIARYLAVCALTTTTAGRPCRSSPPAWSTR